MTTTNLHKLYDCFSDPDGYPDDVLSLCDNCANEASITRTVIKLENTENMHHCNHCGCEN